MPQVQPVSTLKTNMLVPWFLMSSYLYYFQDEAVLSDCEYDALCRRLQFEFDFADHPHKHLIPREDLAAGTGFAITEYPERVKHAAAAWLEEHTGRKIVVPKNKPKAVSPTDFFNL